MTFHVPKLNAWGGIDEPSDSAPKNSRHKSNSEKIAAVEFLIDQQRSFVSASQLQVFQVTITNREVKMKGRGRHLWRKNSARAERDLPKTHPKRKYTHKVYKEKSVRGYDRARDQNGPGQHLDRDLYPKRQFTYKQKQQGEKRSDSR